VAYAIFITLTAQAQAQPNTSEGLFGKPYSCELNKEIHKQNTNSQDGKKYILDLLDEGKARFGNQKIYDIIYDEKNNYWTGKMNDKNGQLKYVLAIRNGSVVMQDQESKGKAFFVCSEQFFNQGQVAKLTEAKSRKKTLSSVRVDRTPTNIAEVDRLKSLLITEISDDVMRAAIAQDQIWSSSQQIEGQRIRFQKGASYQKIKAIVDRLLESIEIDASQWLVRIVDTEEKVENAFVTGGRIIYIFTGLIDNAKSDDELAFILGHEIGHALLKHNRERVDNEAASLIETIASIGATLSKNQNRKYAFELIGGAISSYYSRDHEREADAFGAYIARKAGYKYMEGRNFFARSLTRTRSVDAFNDQQIALMSQQVNSQLENCELQKQQFNSNPIYRSKANAEVVNRTCQQAIENVQRLQEHHKQKLRSIFTRTHPIDEERITNLTKIGSYMSCAISEQAIEGIGVGVFVLKALDVKQDCR
jgi:Zn-dependent protease with chaperone function